MDISYMRSKMVHEELSNADIKAIAKARGFSKKEAASRDVFENFLLSEIGVEEVMAGLSTEEAALLHLLSIKDEPVDITLFARLYGEAGQGQRYYYGTFTQRYQPTFKKVRQKLIRKGLLLFAEQDYGGDTKMERRRFRFPPQLQAYLPPLVKGEHTYEGEGDFRREAVLREKLAEILVSRGDSGHTYQTLYVSNGDLMMGDQPFQASMLQDWLRVRWEAHLPGRDVPGQINLPVISAVRLIFSGLQPHNWLRPAKLDAPLRILCHGSSIPKGTKVCAVGWKWGCLAKHTANGESYYRMPIGEESPSGDDAPAPGTYLTPQGEGVRVDLARIPYHQLEQLNRMVHFEVAGGKLTATPDFVKMGRAEPAGWELPLTRWLCENVPSFDESIQAVMDRWGQQIVHANLCIAKVEDLTLKVQIERAFSDPGTMLSLPNDHVAFPKEQLPAVQKIVSRAGYVIKTISSDANPEG